MNPSSPICWLYVYGFLGQNLKKWILRLFLDIWKSGSLCDPQMSAEHLQGVRGVKPKVVEYASVMTTHDTLPLAQ